MKTTLKLLTLFVAAVVLLAGSAMAGTITSYSGQDDGASTSGPWPNSSAAQSAFLTAAGSTTLIDFESQALGFYSPIVVGPVSITLNAPNYGSSFSGIGNANQGNLYAFNTTSGGSQWLGFPGGSATFNFASPVSSFGFWITGIQTVFTTEFTVTFNDGTDQTLNIPINVNGGAQYFGFTDAGGTTSAITITNLSDDAWGIDDVRYGSSSVPEPGTLVMFGSGLLGLASIARRKFNV